MYPTLRTLSPYTLATLLLLWIFSIHTTSLYLFTRGFLLSRLALENKSVACSSDQACLPPTHSKAVILIIDALRFDFITPNPPIPLDEYHHNVLTLPAELTAAHPGRSFIFDSHSDPPTATLQRIKGITTGSLPTFVDLGSSFGGSAVKEDSLIHQLVASGKRIAFMGDDTWETVYPTSFAPNMSWPYDSFNVEDLHTVDEGVIRHLFPLLNSPEPKWDVAIGHMLGVDHAGHRVGPSGATMRAKLYQMDKVLRQVVQYIDDDTLLVVLGDHGMDTKGDHGGDGIFETSAAMWVYSKAVPLATLSREEMHGDLFPMRTYPNAPKPARFIQQIDIVPTISLLLGVPIPFNNLGMVIPELFLRQPSPPVEETKEQEHETHTDWKSLLRLGKDRHPSPEHDQEHEHQATPPNDNTALSLALRLNAQQIRTYLEAYRSSPSGGELDAAWDKLHDLHSAAAAPSTTLTAQSTFIRQTLEECRALWAQFNMLLMLCGLGALTLSVPTVWVVYRSSQRTDVILGQAAFGAVSGALIGLWFKVVFSRWIEALSMTEMILFGGVIGSEWGVISSFPFSVPSFTLRPKSFTAFHRTTLPVIVLILHALSYTSNSFVMWEDRLAQYFLITLLVPSIISAPSAPSSRFRHRIVLFGLAAAVLLRLAAISTVCREEQHPYCHVTFYSALGAQAAPWASTLLAPVCALVLPSLVRRFLANSQSDKVLAPFFIEGVWRVLLCGGAAYWVLERMENAHGLHQDTVDILQSARVLTARAVMIGSTFGAGWMWWFSSAYVEQDRTSATDEAGKKHVTITLLGHANAYGSSYLAFILVGFAPVFLVTQPTGQVVLSFILVALLCYIEVDDMEKDSLALAEALTPDSSWDQVELRAQPPAFVNAAFVSLLSLAAFYTTGHQAVLSTIQWKTAFIGFPVVTYPFAPVLVALNTLGPIALVAMTVPFFALWNVSPPWPSTTANTAEEEERVILSQSVKMAVGVSLYHSTLTLGTATSAAILRRHLMVWKVFAPRFMLGGVTLVVVDLALVLGVGLGVREVMGKTRRMFDGRKKTG